MATAINTPPTAPDLTNLGIWSYAVGGKVKAAYQQFYEICMATLATATTKTSIAGTPVTVVTPTRVPRITKAASPAGAAQTPRRLGRPPGSTAAAIRARKSATVSQAAGNITDAVLTAVSVAGTPRKTLLANPTLKDFRPNHIGMAITRHLKAARIIERDGMLYNTANTTTEFRATG